MLCCIIVPNTFFINDSYFFSIIAGLQCSVNFLLYSKVTRSHIHIHILFSHIIMLVNGLLPIQVDTVIASPHSSAF